MMPLPALAFGKIASAIGIKGFIAIGIALALGIVMWRADAISEDREALRNTLATERAQHAVTRQSLMILEGELAKMVRDGELRASRLAEARQEQQERTEALRGQAERIRAEGAAEGDPCATPDAVRNAGGL
jgi:hypothetical protein